MEQIEASAFKQILEGCRRRDRSYQNALYRLFYPYGMSIYIRYADNEVEAISILNDGFLKVFQNLKKYDSEQPFKPWFRKILINTALNHIKKQKRFKMEVQLDAAGQMETREDILSRIVLTMLMGTKP